ncbi:MAG: hypothetical protein ACOYKA_04840 [Legionellaceae bacterium]
MFNTTRLTLTDIDNRIIGDYILELSLFEEAVQDAKDYRLGHRLYGLSDTDEKLLQLAVAEASAVITALNKQLPLTPDRLGLKNPPKVAFTASTNRTNTDLIVTLTTLCARMTDGFKYATLHEPFRARDYYNVHRTDYDEAFHERNMLALVQCIRRVREQEDPTWKKLAIALEILAVVMMCAACITLLATAGAALLPVVGMTVVAGACFGAGLFFNKDTQLVKALDEVYLTPVPRTGNMG